ncbi:MAG: hypothetical protein LBR81_06385 [Prevotellaceae bacterium]|jgi:hypothetical protein|nr:hypothetical protein [Prevotellaceae bacterium]
MKKIIFTTVIALMGAWATAFANQEAFYGTWTYQSGPLTDTYTVSAEGVTWKITMGPITVIGDMTIENLTWTPIDNSDGATMGDYPSGYYIEGTITSVSGDMLASFSAGETFGISLFISNDNTQVFNGIYVYSNGSTTSDETISADAVQNPVAFFNTMGVKLPGKPETGIYIVLYDNGIAEKKIILKN